MSQSETTDNADWGLTVETAVCQRWPGLEHIANDRDEPDWYDARFTEALVTDDLELHIADAGDPVEIKACEQRVVDGESSRRGRWWIRQGAHEQLLATDGFYVLAIYDRTADEVVQRAALLDARTVDELITTWSACGNGRVAARLRWNRVFKSANAGDDA